MEPRSNRDDDLPEDYESAVEALMRDHQARTASELRASAARRTRTVSDMHEYWKRIQQRRFVRRTNESKSSRVPHHVPRAILHIAGTKGKGSTACMCESILRREERQSCFGSETNTTTTTGLFTSPHLVCIRERIRINGKPVGRKIFARAYWLLRKALEEYPSATNDEGDSGGLPVLPGYFRMLTLMAVAIFTHYCKVDIIVLEVGMGGRYDATNFVTDLFQHCEANDDACKCRCVCGIALLDYDHTRVLGNTLEEIAYEKVGIFKASTTHKTVYALDSPTYAGTSVRQVLTDWAREQGGSIQWIPPQLSATSILLSSVHPLSQHSPEWELHKQWLLPPDASVGLPGNHQRWNAELALRLCGAATTAPEGIPKNAIAAIRDATWPGRGQVVEYDHQYPDDSNNDVGDRTKWSSSIRMRFYLDGAHTVQSVRAALEWFHDAQHHRPQSRPVLLFACSHERNPVEILELLLDCRPISFRVVYFVATDASRPSSVPLPTADQLLPPSSDETAGKDCGKSNNVTWPETLQTLWSRLEDKKRRQGISPTGAVSKTHANLTVTEALTHLAREESTGTNSASAEAVATADVFVTGSLYLVGSVLASINWIEDEENGVGNEKVAPSSTGASY